MSSTNVTSNESFVPISHTTCRHEVTWRKRNSVRNHGRFNHPSWVKSLLSRMLVDCIMNTVALLDGQSHEFRLLIRSSGSSFALLYPFRGASATAVGQGAEASEESPAFVPLPAESQLTHTVGAP